jgi:DNA polymerase-3 subunit alpha
MKYIEAAGLVKFDFLGLKTLTLLAKAIDLISNRGINIDLLSLPLDDKKTYEMLSRGDSIGVFQLESTGMRDVIRKLKPDTFEDIIAIVALYRPGPMDNIPSYIARKHGLEEPDYLYPTLEGILKETFGIMIYQEQVMQVAQELSGYTLGNADLLRRAMSKKDQIEMEKQRQVFVDGAHAKAVPKDKASQIFDQVNMFAGYGFNKSHAAAYALVAYQTAFFKANYPVEFLAASMSLDINNTDKLNIFRQELSNLGVDVLGPDINSSAADFQVEACSNGKTGVRYALAAIKNVGDAAMCSLVEERKNNGPFLDIADFTQRVDSKVVNKRLMENLVKAGAFDSLDPNRRRLYDSIEVILRHSNAASLDRKSNQIGLFDVGDSPMTPLTLSSCADWSSTIRMKEEFDAIGFYLSGHPLDTYKKSLVRLKVRSSADIVREGLSGPAIMAGTVISKVERISGKGNRYAFVQLTDVSGIFEIMVFSELLSVNHELFEPGSSLLIKAGVQFKGEAPKFTANIVEPLDKVASKLQARLSIQISSSEPLVNIKDALRNSKSGTGEITFVTKLEDGREIEIKLKDSFEITPNLLLSIRNISGIEIISEN